MSGIEKQTTGQNSLANPDCKPLQWNKTGYSSFNQFYPYYLGEHSLPITRRLHNVGTTISLATHARFWLSFLPALFPNAKQLERLNLSFPRWKLFAAGIFSGYFFAWVSHFFIEKNRPATFKAPVYSLMGDMKLWWEVVTFQRAF
ncbi:uncharacterized protein L969DRAFT_54470 [Mixia osmundae IAM 14324]|uniref:DUF962 domain-containing protein n=1 Tax=Mixia osmundae (strain CBS 9802 / IAM 14324 / JCM 22182 / KY 12970) TaxID=764103 RepID=G7E1K4_MIXOS|nr:uncharacterized protein L969DRAFT_54470 [Mixia osmundae IAM 14324]KEI36666.1 hypothetical protein L969DRAFT_54470 [Mixia osmundae IAM 14324]GAA96714.1 hypothetical protein E5Q_03385 [Mixia osmundae IAM 14324]